MKGKRSGTSDLAGDSHLGVERRRAGRRAGGVILASNKPPQPLPEQRALELSAAGTPSPTSPPGIYYLPSVTPNPFTTPIEAYQTPTPFVLPSGPRPIIIGYSVSGRPLEVYKFGQGERQVMIAAGIHGGYEWNTIALADELLTYINEKPEIVPSDVTLFILRNINPDGDARAHSIEGTGQRPWRGPEPQLPGELAGQLGPGRLLGFNGNHRRLTPWLGAGDARGDEFPVIASRRSADQLP